MNDECDPPPQVPLGLGPCTKLHGWVGKLCAKCAPPHLVPGPDENGAGRPHRSAPGGSGAEADGGSHPALATSDQGRLLPLVVPLL